MTDPRFELTEKEKELLQRYYRFYRELETGTHVPTTEAQEHFVAICRGLTSVKTEHERAYAKYMRKRAAEEKKRREAAEGELPDYEEGYPNADWFTDADWKKLRSREYADMKRRHREPLREPEWPYTPMSY